MIIRAEPGGIMFFIPCTGRRGIITGKELEKLLHWLETGKENSFTDRLSHLHIMPYLKDRKKILKEEIEKSYNIKSPPASFAVPESLHIDLTSRCLLNCPQCYRDRTSGIDMDFNFLKNILKEAEKINIFQIAFGGGEPLLYPRLVEAVSAVNSYGMSSTVTTGGAGLNKDYLQKLIDAGINHIQISLNGSTPEINSRSRDGYKEAIEALSLLKSQKLSYGINWTARRDNLEEFPSMIYLARQYRVKNINILRLKPDRKGSFKEQILSPSEFIRLGEYIKKYSLKGPVIKIDSSFSSLLCWIYSDRHLPAGCGAGRYFMSVDMYGNFRACSHMTYGEKYDTIIDYWYESAFLNKLRIPEDIGEPCSICLNFNKCRGCRVICKDLYGDFYGGETGCPAYKSFIER